MLTSIQFCLVLACVQWSCHCFYKNQGDYTKAVIKQLDDNERKVQDDMGINIQIVNGENTTRGEFPHMALLLRYNNLRCGGSLISKQHVLTAAHCVSGLTPRSLSVRMGAYLHAQSKEAGSVTYNVSRVSIYPNWTVWATDVAVLTLNDTVEFTDLVKPIRLAQPSDGQFINNTATLSGWGRIVGGGFLSPRLLKLQASVVPNEFCNKKFQNETEFEYPNITDTALCLYKVNQSGCHGDSGSPLFTDVQETGERIQVGVVSGGHVRCKLGMPNVFTRVSEFYQWIKATMANSSSLNAVEYL